MNSGVNIELDSCDLGHGLVFSKSDCLQMLHFDLSWKIYVAMLPQMTNIWSNLQKCCKYETIEKIIDKKIHFPTLFDNMLAR